MQSTVKEARIRKSPLKRYSTKIFNFFLPLRCLNCGSYTQGEELSLCAKCWSNINFIGKPYCSICSYPFEYDVGIDTLCISCAADKPAFDNALSIFIYSDNSKHLITSLKYADKTYSAQFLASLMASRGKEILAMSDYIISVPIHPVRLISRKFNQSALLANNLGKEWRKKIRHDILKRIKNNEPQAALSRKERLTNVKGAFAFNKNYGDIIKDKSILIIDDVMTTGATISECSRILKKAGAKNVYAITLARTVEGK